MKAHAPEGFPPPPGICSTASNARLTVNDGATTTTSAWHTGSSTWEWLSLTHTVSASATYLNGGLEVASGTKTGYISGATMVLGGDLPTNYIPAPVSPGTLVFQVPGAVDTTGYYGYFRFSRPTIILDTQLYVVTAPATNVLTVKPRSGTTDMYTTTFPNIAVAANNAGLAVNGTYQYRCFTGGFGNSPAANSLLQVYVDIGSSTAA